MESIAQHYQITFEKNGIGLRFQELIVKLHQKTGERVVILIDEYDKPITDVLEFENYDQAIAHRDILRMFYGIIKGTSAHIKLFFMTGISRFGKVSLFSELNNLTDITFNKQYHNICGYTKDELVTYFQQHIRQVASENQTTVEETLANIQAWYNGYSWDGNNRVYNPFSVLRFLEDAQFNNYWFESGTPKFLVKLMAADNFYDVRNVLADFAVFNSYDITNLNVPTLMFQTGYLTVKNRNEYDQFVLEYPNKEVEFSMTHYLLADYIGKTARVTLTTSLIEAVKKHDFDLFTDTLNTLLSGVPYHLFEKKREVYFHAIVYLSLRLCGFYIQAEVNSSKGRLDAVLRYENRVYIFEFKLDKSADDALAQIRQKQYYKPYQTQQTEIYLVGINFSSEKKEVEAWKIEKV